MTLSQAKKIFSYWDESPPEHEILAILARAQTNWEPKSSREMTEEERQIAHRASLEARWKSGSAMNIKQMFEATGGRLAVGPGGGTGPVNMGGIGPFPGAH